MTSAMIIEHKVSCAWLRSRDLVIFLVSWFLWSALLATVPRADFSVVFALQYGTMLTAIGAMFFAWSHLHRVYADYSAFAGRRSDAVLPADALANHFGIDVARLAAIQQGKRLVILHSSAGQIVEAIATDAFADRPPNPVTLPVTSPVTSSDTKQNYSEAA